MRHRRHQRHRRPVAAVIVALSIGWIFAACAPPKEPAPLPPAPEGLQPPDEGPPPNSPALAVDTGFVTGLVNPLGHGVPR
jgi:hypothetical protein